MFLINNSNRNYCLKYLIKMVLLWSGCFSCKLLVIYCKCILKCKILCEITLICGAGNAYPSRAPGLTPVQWGSCLFNLQFSVQYFVDLCLFLCPFACFIPSNCLSYSLWVSVSCNFSFLVTLLWIQYCVDYYFTYFVPVVL